MSPNPPNPALVKPMQNAETATSIHACGVRCRRVGTLLLCRFQSVFQRVKLLLEQLGPHLDFRVYLADKSLHAGDHLTSRG